MDGDKTKLDGIETGADVTDADNVESAGALMDSEVTNLAQVKAFDETDYATSTQGALADTALQEDTDISVNSITQNELSADPADPAGGSSVTWQSDGTGSGDDGDIMMKITAGGVTKTVTLIDFSDIA